MIRIGTFGKRWITEQFIKNAKLINDIEISCVYYRSMQKGKIFALKNNLLTKVVDKLEDMIDYVDAVYIASPNGLHYYQATYFLQLQKHVFVEKPICFKTEQVIPLKTIANKNHTFLLEAFKPVHLPQFSIIKQLFSEHKPLLAQFNWNQYSSRMNDVLNGKYTSVFDENLGKGSLYDALIYPLQFAIGLFGSVISAKAMINKLENGVDLNNVVILKHQTDVMTSIVASKSAQGVIGSEILSYDQTITFNNLTQIKDLRLFDLTNNSSFSLFNDHTSQDALYYETKQFIDLIKNYDLNKMNYFLELSIETVRVIELIENDEKT